MLLKDYIEQIRGVSYKPQDVEDNAGIPILRANNIQDGHLVFDELVYLNKSVVKEKQVLVPGDIVICASSGSKDLVGKAAVFNSYYSSMSFGAFCKVVRVKNVKGIFPDFIRLFFQSPTYRKQIASSSSGSNINNIKNENIDQLVINIPEIETQKEATEILNELISLMESKQHYLLLLDELIESRFCEMFGEETHEELLVKCVDIQYGYPFDSKLFNIDSKGVPIIRIRDIVRGFSETFTTEPCGKEYIVKKNDILIGMDGEFNIGKWNSDDALLNQRICKIISKSKVVDEYIFYCLKPILKSIENETSAVTVKHLSAKVLNNLLIKIPDQKSQIVFSDFVKTINEIKNSVYQEINGIQELLNNKMDEYFGDKE